MDGSRKRGPFADVSKLGYHIETQQFSPAPRVGPPQKLACACALQLAFQGFPWASLTIMSSRVLSLPATVHETLREVNFVGLHNSHVLCEGNDERSETLSISAHVSAATDCDGCSRTLAASERNHEVPWGLAWYGVNRRTPESIVPFPPSLFHIYIFP